MAFLILFCGASWSQSKTDSLGLHLALEFNKKALVLSDNYVSAAKDTLTLETFRCYISGIEILYNDHTVFKESNSYHLLDMANPESFYIPLTKKSDKSIATVFFNIGIDSLTNTSGAMGGDLDPAKGMYWAWQSGYINMKIEGKSPSCSIRKNEFQFHLGGYLQPYYAMRRIKFSMDKKADSDITIGIDLYPFFSNIDLSETNSVIVPGKTAMKLSDYATKMFYLQ